MTTSPVKWNKVDNPAAIFESWAFTIKPVLWSALGIQQREFIDSVKSETYRLAWEKQNPRYETLKSIFFRKRQVEVQDHPDWEEWGILQDNRLKVQARYLAYVVTDPIEYDFHEGDVFWSRDGFHYLQVISDSDDLLEVKFKVSTVVCGYWITSAQLAHWLKTGDVPIQGAIGKHQSRSEIARYYEYTE